MLGPSASTVLLGTTPVKRRQLHSGTSGCATKKALKQKIPRQAVLGLYGEQAGELGNACK